MDVSGEVGGALGEALSLHLAAQALKRLLEIGAEAGTVVLAQHGQNIGLFRAELLGHKVGHDAALEGVKEADPEVVRVQLRHGGVGAGYADGGNLRLLKGGRGGNGHAGPIRAQHHGHARVHQRLGGGNGLVGGGLVIHDFQLHVVGLAANLHGRNHLIGILHAQHLLLAAGAVVAGRGLKHAHLQHGIAAAGRAAAGAAGCTAAGIPAAGGEREGHGKSHGKRKKLFHVLSSCRQ